jgi:Right handed beta helix region
MSIASILARSPLRTLLAGVLGLASSMPAQCGSTISIPAVNTTWTLQGSPYCVTQTITVGNLTIEPGVEVRLAPGVSLNVVSWLRALGTREQPITFRAQNVQAGRWGGIEFAGPVAPGNTSLLQHCVVTEANNSGVRIANNDQVTLDGCLVRNNTSPLDGGGILVQLTGGTVVLFDCDVEGNRAARHGGGIAATMTGGAVLALTSCRIHANLANPANAGGSFEGGGIRASGSLALLGCSVLANDVGTQTCGGTITARGGGIHCANGDVLIANTIVMHNECSTFTQPTTCGGQNGIAEGGGVFAGATVGTLRIESSIVASNTATAGGQVGTRRGSGVQSAAATTLLTNCTIARNADEGFRAAGGVAHVTNSIVYYHPVANIVGTVTATFSAIQGGYQGNGNIVFDPAFVGPGSQPDHYTLASFSPCIDAGDPAAVNEDACRPPGQGTARNDMGAQGGLANCGFSGPSVMTCGAQTYGELRQGVNAMTLDWQFTSSQPPFPGTLAVDHGFAQSAGLLLLAFAAGETVTSGVTILVDSAGITPLAFATNSAGAWSATLDLQLPFLVGVPVFLQAITLSSGAAKGSNGLRIATCF